MKIPYGLSRSQCVTSFFYTLKWNEDILNSQMEINSFFYPDFAASIECISKHEEYRQLIEEEDMSTYLNSFTLLDKSDWLIMAYRIHMNLNDCFWVLDMLRQDEAAETGKAVGWLNFYLDIDDIAREIIPFRKPFL